MNSEKRKSTEVENDNPRLARLEPAGQINYFDDYDHKASGRGRDEKLKRLLEARHD